MRSLLPAVLSSSSSSLCVTLSLLLYSCVLTSVLLFSLRIVPSQLLHVDHLSPLLLLASPNSSSAQSSLSLGCVYSQQSPLPPPSPSACPSTCSPSTLAVPPLRCYPEHFGLNRSRFDRLAALYDWTVEAVAPPPPPAPNSDDDPTALGEEFRVTIVLSGVQAAEEGEGRVGNASTDCPFDVPTAYFRVNFVGWDPRDPSLSRFYHGTSEYPVALDRHSLTTRLSTGTTRHHFRVTRVRLWCPDAEWPAASWNVSVHLSFLSMFPVRTLLVRELTEFAPEVDSYKGELIELPLEPRVRRIDHRPCRPATPVGEPKALPLCGSPQHEERIVLDALRTYPDSLSPSPFTASSIPGSVLLTGVAGLGRTPNPGGQLEVSHFEFHPFECSVDRGLDLREELRRHRWVQLMGDSNTRELFGHLCRHGQGQLYVIDQLIPLPNVDGRTDFYNPKLCIGPDEPDPESETRASAPGWVLTYYGWIAESGSWNSQVETLDDEGRYNFVSECEAFVRWRNSTAELQANRTLFVKFRGWPGCDLIPSSSSLYRALLAMDGPSATTASWGSHQPGWSTNRGQLQNLVQSWCMGANYFHRLPTVFLGTTDSLAAWIPIKFGPQFTVRNNERIASFNHLMAYAATRLIHKDAHFGGCQQRASCWFPMYDVFRISTAAASLMHSDAQHLLSPAYMEILRHLFHMFRHAPQFNHTLRRRLPPWRG